jgi:hypothetical protein
MPANRAAALQVIDPVLTGLARAYRPSGFIYEQLVKTFPVSTLTGQYPMFPREAWYANEVDNEIRDRAPSKEIDFDWTIETYAVKEYALKISITELERQQAHPALKLEQNKNAFLSLRMAIAREARIERLLYPTNTGITGKAGQLTASNESTPSNKWDTATSNPDADLKTARLALYNLIGVLPNVIVLPYAVAYALAVQHGTDTFRGQMIYTVNGGDMISMGDRILPNTIHGMRVVIPQGAQISSANEGGSYAGSDIWGKHARLLYVADSAEWGNPSVLYSFKHTAVTTTKWSQTDPDVDYQRQLERMVEKVVAPDAGYVLTNVIS